MSAPTRPLAIEPLVIPAPFGNYLSSPGATSTLGTYTVKDRAGWLRWRTIWRVLWTLRYRRGLGWVNKLGLPNPGLEHLQSLPVASLCGKIVSLHGFDELDWTTLVEACWRAPLIGAGGFELNVSCPNVGHLSVPRWLFEQMIETPQPVIVKLPPVNYWRTFLAAYEAGVKNFHCCNTLPVPGGGLSGKPLQRLSLDVIERVLGHDDTLTIIGGGGIEEPHDLLRYHNAGAKHFAIGSALLKLRYWFGPWRNSYLATMREAAAQAQRPGS